MYTVKQARQLSGKTQQEMAALLGVSRDTYRKIESNPETATIKQAQEFCSIAGFSIDQIFSPQCLLKVGSSKAILTKLLNNATDCHIVQAKTVRKTVQQNKKQKM